MTNTITMPCSVVEWALEAFTRGCPPDCKDGMTDSGGVYPWGEPALIRCPACRAFDALRAALNQPQVNSPEIPEGWKLVPVEPTEEMLRSSCGCESPAMFRESLRRETDGRLTAEMVEKIIRRHLASYRAMLAAAPQPPVVEQPQVEQEPVAWIENIGGGVSYNPYHEAARKLPDGVRFDLYTRPQPCQPLTDAQINGHRLALPYDGEDLPDPWDFKQGVRAAERAHRIGGEA